MFNSACAKIDMSTLFDSERNAWTEECPLDTYIYV